MRIYFEETYERTFIDIPAGGALEVETRGGDDGTDPLVLVWTGKPFTGHDGRVRLEPFPDQQLGVCLRPEAALEPSAGRLPQYPYPHERVLRNAPDGLRIKSMKVIKVNPKTDPGTADTATVEVNGVTRDVAAFISGDYVTIYGLSVRYRTGSKVWPGSAMYWPATGHINNVRGPQDHRSTFRPVSVVGFWEDAKEQYKSEHSSVVGGR